MQTYYIGIDVGNYDTKSERTTTPSGYRKSDIMPTVGNEYLKCGDTYYTESKTDRFDYIPDKTINEQMFILTLYGIVKELFARAQDDKLKSPLSIAALQGEEIHVHLAVGVPPAHHAKLAKKYVDYYKENFGSGLGIDYKGTEMTLILDQVKVFAQDYSAIMAFQKKSKYISQGHTRYYAIDIGGKTVDSVVIVDKVPDKYKSVESGILTMYDEIETKIMNDYGIKLDHIACENILMHKPSVIDEEIKNKVFEIAKEWTDSIIAELRQGGLEFSASPSIFIGGGAIILKPFITSNKLVKNFEFLGNSNINALAYAKLLKASNKLNR